MQTWTKAAFTAVILTFGTGASTALAATVSVNTDPGQTYVSANGMGSSSVKGSELGGMNVDVEFADGSSQSIEWSRVNNNAGQAVGGGFNLSYGSWDFTLSATSLIKSFSISTLGLNAVFDIGVPQDTPEDTPGSLRGISFRVLEGDPVGEIAANYSNRVLVDGHMTGEDLYTDLSVDFSGLEGGGFFGDMRFLIDLDAFAVADDLTLAPVPLPAGMTLLLSGVALLGLGRKRKA